MGLGWNEHPCAFTAARLAAKAATQERRFTGLIGSLWRNQRASGRRPGKEDGALCSYEVARRRSVEGGTSWQCYLHHAGVASSGASALCRDLSGLSQLVWASAASSAGAIASQSSANLSHGHVRRN